MRYFTFSLYTKSLKSDVYFILTVYLNLENKISAEIHDLYLELTKFTVEKNRFIHPSCSKHT